MIWEVDEDCDGSLSWVEFQAMYHRCRNDLTGKLSSSTDVRQCQRFITEHQLNGRRTFVWREQDMNLGGFSM